MKDVDRQRRALELFREAVEQPPEQRDAFMQRACHGDRDLLAHVEALLQQDEPGAGVTHALPEQGLGSGSSFSEDVVQRLAGRAGAFGRYKLEGEIAHGGQGAIVRVWDEDLRRHLAMKVVLGQRQSPSAKDTPPVDPKTLGRFLEEAQVTGQLDHPNIVPVHELGLDAQGRLYFTMKLVKGRDLRQIFELVRSGKEGWNLTRALGVLLRVCEAMAYAHAKGVIHRDLKPGNVMVGRFGEVYVMDWGLARVLARNGEKGRQDWSDPTVSGELESERRQHSDDTLDSPLVTRDGDVLGTPAYMSPEQARGDLDAMSQQSDVYALGAMLYHLLTERMPYDEPGERFSPRELLHEVLAGPPRPVHQLAPDVPAELAAICEKAMSHAPTGRYEDMSLLADDLRAYLEHRVVGAYQTGAIAELRMWTERNKPLAASLAVVFGLVLTGAGMFAWLSGELSDKNVELDGAVRTMLAQARTWLEVTPADPTLVRAAEDLYRQLTTQWPDNVELLHAIVEELGQRDIPLARALDVNAALAIVERTEGELADTVGEALLRHGGASRGMRGQAQPQETWSVDMGVMLLERYPPARQAFEDLLDADKRFADADWETSRGRYLARRMMAFEAFFAAGLITPEQAQVFHREHAQLRDQDQARVEERTPEATPPPPQETAGVSGEPRSRALLIAVESYDLAWGWTPLTGPRRDALAVKRALIERGGFAEHDIELLLDEQASRSGILQALDGLVERAGPDDLLFVFYAGHGSRIPDDDGDEPDGWDETLVPVDAMLPDGRPNDVRDDEIGAFIAAANERTDNVVLVFDCCMSGTNVRGSGPRVSRYVPPESRGFTGVELDEPADAAKTEPLDDFAEALSYVALQACRSSQSAYELPVAGPEGTVTRGLFTTSLVQELYQLAPETSYGDLLRRVRRRVTAEEPEQTPVSEGSLQRRLLFAGRAVEQDPYFELTRVGDAWLIDGGAGVGVSAGDELTVCHGRAPRASPADRLGEVLVEEVGPMRARVTWVGEPVELEMTAGPLRVFASGARRSSHALCVRLEGENGEAVGELSRRLRNQGPLELRSDADVQLIARLGEDGRWSVASMGGVALPLGADSGDPEALDRLAQELGALGQANTLSRSLAAIPDGLPLRCKLEHVDEGGNVLAELPAGFGLQELPVLADKELVRLSVLNDGDVPLWVCVLVIAPDGEIQQAWSMSEDEPLAPGASRSRRWPLSVSEGLQDFFRAGSQRFVCLAAERPLDLSRFEQLSVTRLSTLRGGGVGNASASLDGLDERLGVTVFDLTLSPVAVSK